ncbi:MAG: hypothetical protein ACI4JM_09440 [Oscillospiraceae bacterium]
MDILNKIIMTACLCGTAVSICDMLCADSRYSKQINFILSLVFVTGIITPVSYALKNFDVSAAMSGIYEYNTDRAKNNEEYIKYLKRAVEDNINASFRDILESEGISVRKIYSEVDISENYSISIIKAGIECDDFEKAAEIIKSTAGEEFEIWNMDCA